MRRVAVFLVALLWVGVALPARAGTTVTIVDSEFTPNAVSASSFATGFAWVNNDAFTHTATSDLDSATPFFDVLVPTAGISSTDVKTAGTFPYHCDIHPDMKASLSQALSGDTSAVVGELVRVQFSDGLPSGYTVDVQVKKPGKKYKTFADDVIGTIASLTVTRAGSYRFRARVNSNTGGSSRYSVPFTVTVFKT